tara:strand:+ start:1116157 stop:1116582 length:426 start_codon:yes stop_codon:yes gene_type:complete
MAVVGRILRISRYLDRRVNQSVEPFGIAIWGFDLLATLRRQGAPYAMTPSDLMQSVMLSSGAMTNRIDKLEEMGLVRRKPSPSDRRSLLVELTGQGLKVIDEAIAVRFKEADDAVSGLTKKDQKQLGTLLKQMLMHLESQA